MILSRLLTTAAKTAPASSRFVQKSLLSSSSQSHLIVNAVGKDRLGIVSEISKHVTDIGGNVGESQATKLGSHFSMMMLIQIPAEQKEHFESQLATMADMNTTVFETEAASTTAVSPQIAYSGYFQLEGANYPGIVHKVTTFLAQNGLSVDRLETSDAEIAPHGGTCLFQMKGIANALEPLAAGFSVERIEEGIDKLADELNCDITIQNVTHGDADDAMRYGS
ncbi:cleavage system transcriptional repressor [Seminavis robusta]|uniref:Cleavage system transcriptional repressor n=1 Tax=Seminavis robusta TaxID=568900 RepID=A0A9N8HFD0_9STRA|nr:cleavage system transcriptional repressor [Seminavis robusta]|eukprot:Sro344_g122220.1 cleavage system transcriptional repressor (223) ;mRNA; r:39451-40200